MRKVYLCLLVAGIATCMASGAGAVDVTVYPDGLEHSTGDAFGVAGDYPAGWGDGSHQSSGTGKDEYYFTPAQLFGHAVSVGDIASISWYTKKDLDYITQPGDWYTLIYTEPVATGWYGTRIHSEPYFSENLNAPVNTWNQWTSDGGTSGTDPNYLRFYVGGVNGAGTGYYGSYTDLHWDDFLAANPAVALQSVLYFNLSTGSGWASGLNSLIDGYTVTLVSGETGSVNFEPAVSTPDGGLTLALLGLSTLGAGLVRRRLGK